MQSHPAFNFKITMKGITTQIQLIVICNHYVVTQTSLVHRTEQTSNQRGKIKQTDVVVSRLSMCDHDGDSLLFLWAFYEPQKDLFKVYVINAPPGLNNVWLYWRTFANIFVEWYVQTDVYMSSIPIYISLQMLLWLIDDFWGWDYAQV